MKANVDVKQTRRIKGALKVHTDCTRPSTFCLRGLLQRLVSLSSPSGALQGAQLSFPKFTESISFRRPCIFNSDFLLLKCIHTEVLPNSLELASPRFQTSPSPWKMKSPTPHRKRKWHLSAK